MRGESLGESVVVVGIVAVSATGELPVQARIRRPRGAGLLDAKPELAGGIGAAPPRRRAGGRGPGLSREGREQAGFGAELVVDRDPRHTRSFRQFSDARFETELGDLPAGGGENPRARLFDLGLAPAQPVFPSGHLISLTDSLFNQYG